MQSELFPKRGRGWRARVAGSGPASCTGGPRGVGGPTEGGVMGSAPVHRSSEQRPAHEVTCAQGTQSEGPEARPARSRAVGPAWHPPRGLGCTCRA